MATPKKDPKDRLPMGRPKIPFKPEYCGLLIEHMREGGSLEAFGARVGCCKDTIRSWLDEHPDFSAARKEGFPHLESFYQNLGKTMASGQLRRIKSEKPLLDKKGKPVLDPNTGKVMYEREYEHVTGSPAAWIFLTKNMLGWRDKKDVEISGKEGGPINFSNMSDEDLRKELERLQEESNKFLAKK